MHFNITINRVARRLAALLATATASVAVIATVLVSSAQASGTPTTMTSGYFAASDGYQHVIAATYDGKVHELYFTGGGQPVGQDVLAQYNGVRSVAGYFDPADGYQHVIVATTDGNVREVYFKGNGQPVGQHVLASLTTAQSVAGYSAASDGDQHVIVATDDGNVHELYFRPKRLFWCYTPCPSPVRQRVLAHFNGAGETVAGYFAASDGYQHVIVSDDYYRVQEFTPGTDVYEIYFTGIDQPVGQDVLASWPPY